MTRQMTTSKSELNTEDRGIQTEEIDSSLQETENQKTYAIREEKRKKRMKEM